MRAWFAAGFVVAIVLAWVAAKLHASFTAPIGSLSIGFGVFLGIALGALSAWCNVRPQRTLIAAACFLTFVAIVAQHAWLYVEFRREWHQARATTPEIAMFRPEAPWSPAEYFGRELKAGRAPVWCVDAALIAAPAIGIFWMMERKRREVGVAANANQHVPQNLNPEP